MLVKCDMCKEPLVAMIPRRGKELNIGDMCSILCMKCLEYELFEMPGEIVSGDKVIGTFKGMANSEEALKSCLPEEWEKLYGNSVDKNETRD